jgi:hypothetical protein
MIIKPERLSLEKLRALASAAPPCISIIILESVQTLRHGGDVQTLPETSMPSGGPICAIFRYAPEVS